MGDEVNYEAAQEETDYQDQEEEEDDEGGDTDSIKTNVKSIIDVLSEFPLNGSLLDCYIILVRISSNLYPFFCIY